MRRRHQQNETVEPQHTFHGILPVRVRDLQARAQKDHFVGAQAQFGPQQMAQADGLWRFGLETGLAVAGAQLANFIFQPRRLLRATGATCSSNKASSRAYSCAKPVRCYLQGLQPWR